MVFFQQRRNQIENICYTFTKYQQNIVRVYLSYRISKSQILRCCQSLFGFESVQNLLAVNILFLFSIAAGFRLRFICYWLSIVEKVLMCLDLWRRMHLHKILRNLIVNMIDSTNALMTLNLFIQSCIDYYLSKDD